MSQSQSQHSDVEVAALAGKLYASAPLGIRVLQQLRPFICPFSDLLRYLPDEGRMVDVGCGAGLFLGLVGYARPKLRTMGFDVNGRAIAAAQLMAARHFPDRRVTFARSEVDDAWPDGPFDVVSMIDVLHHISAPEQEAAIAKAYDNLYPGGLFLYKDMAQKPVIRAWWNRFHDLVVARQWISYRSIEEVENWLAAMGGEIVARSNRAMGLYGHELIVARKPE